MIPQTFTVTPEHIRFYFLLSFVLHLLVVVSSFFPFIDPAQHSMHTVPVNATNDFVQLYAVSVSQRTRTV